VNHEVNRVIHLENLLLLYHVHDDVMQIQKPELYVDQYFVENMFLFDPKNKQHSQLNNQSHMITYL
jgi:hypothetical protein